MPGECSGVHECDSVHYTLYVYMSRRKQVMYDRVVWTRGAFGAFL